LFFTVFYGVLNFGYYLSDSVMDVDHSLNLTSLTVDNCLRVFKIFLDIFLLIYLHYSFTLSITYQNSAVQHQIFIIYANR